MKNFLFFGFLLVTINLFGQETKFSKADLVTDLDSLVAYIEQVHPSPYTSISKENFYKEIEICKNNLEDSTSLIEYFTFISPIVSKMNDAHTNVPFPLSEWRNINPYSFLFNFQISQDGKMFAPKNYTELPQNAEILSINGVPSKQIVEKLISSISAESESYKIAILNMTFVERFGAFFGFKPSYEIAYKLGEEINTITILGMKLKDVIKAINEQQQQQQQQVQTINTPKDWDYTTLNDAKIGIIDFKEFSDLQLFDYFLDSIFTKIQQEKTENLIIDIRENGGGDSALGDAFFQYISKVPYSQFGKTMIKYSQKRAEFYTEYRKNGFLNYLSDSAFNLLISTEEYGTIITEKDELYPLKENPLRFNGKVYLLTSTFSFSSASSFAWCFQHFNMGKIIGEETGGHIVCFGDIIYITLPISKLQMGVSHKEFYGYGATDENRHGVIPDYKVDANKALDFTIDLINKTLCQ